jgi:hypothetical protein
MKKGKTSKLNIFDDAKCSYGTVDSKSFKSIYINVQSWVSPKNYDERWERVVSNFNREIKQTISGTLNNDLFSNKFMTDLDLRYSGIEYGKKSFMNFEVTLFINTNIDFKSEVIKTEVKKIVNSVNKENFLPNKNFSFSLKKTVLEKVLN